MNIEAQRAVEQTKYAACYRDPDYKMGPERYAAARSDLENINKNLVLPGVEPGSQRMLSLLDVGCGRAEMVRAAISIGYWPVRGLECVDGLCGGLVEHGEITAIPYGDETFDVVSCFDVMEHLPPDDTEKALTELHRVAREAILVSISNIESSWREIDLHVNRRPYAEWAQLLAKLWHPGSVRKVSETGISETWLCLKSVNSTSG